MLLGVIQDASETPCSLGSFGMSLKCCAHNGSFSMSLRHHDHSTSEGSTEHEHSMLYRSRQSLQAGIQIDKQLARPEKIYPPDQEILAGWGKKDISST